MRLRGLYKSVLLLLAGGMLFQATGSCQSQFMGTLTATLASTVASVVTTAVTTAITNSLAGGSAT